MSGKYRVSYLGRDGPAPQNYMWEIYRAGQRLAGYGHDFRDDARWLLLDGQEIAVEIVFLVGGGSQPVAISEEGEQLLDQILP